MSLFRKPASAQRPALLTINARQQQQPEAVGGLPRRFRMFIECERRLADDPLSKDGALGVPIGDGQGLERLVARIAPPLCKRAEPHPLCGPSRGPD
jgi:hypothetical protein